MTDFGKSVQTGAFISFRCDVCGVLGTRTPNLHAYRILGYASDYNQLIDALRARLIELKTSMQNVDELAGLPANYTAKLLSPMPSRSLGRVSLGPSLGAMGVKLAVIEDPDAGKITERLAPAKPGGRQSNAVLIRLSQRFLQKIGRKGGLNSRKNLTLRRRRILARRAGLASARAMARRRLAARPKAAVTLPR